MATFTREEAERDAVPSRAKYTPAQRAFIKAKWPQTVLPDDDEPAAAPVAAKPKAEKKKSTKKKGMFS